MNKRKLGAAVLLLALGLGPVQTSHNYNLKLNNLAYAEEAASEVGGTEGTQAPDASPKADESEGANKDAEKKEGQTTKDGQSSDDSLETGDIIQNEPVTSGDGKSDDKDKDDEKEDKNLEERKNELLAKIDAYESELGKSNAIKLATDAEIVEHGKALEAFKKAIKEADGKELKSLEDDSEKEEVESNYYKAVSKLGYRVYSARDARTELKKQIDKASKLLEIKKDSGLKEVLANSLVVYDDIESQAKSISEKTEELKKVIEEVSKRENIEEEKIALSKEEEKAIDDMKGFPSNKFNELSDKDVFDYKLEALVKIDFDRATDFTEENLKKVEARNIESEKNSVKKYLDAKDALLALIESDVTDSNKVSKALENYDAAVAEAKSLVNEEEEKGSDLDSEYEKLLKEYEEVKSSDIYKNASDEKKKAYDKALEDFKNKKYTTLEELEAAKTKMEKAKNALSVKVSTEEEKEIESVIEKHGDFIKSNEYLRATAELQKAYGDAYDALKEDKTKENLDKVKKAKTDITDYYSKFNAEIESLEKYIDQAKTDSLTEKSLKELKKEYKEKLEEFKSDNSKTIDDINELKEEFDAKLNPKEPEKDSPKAKEDAKKKTTKKVVTSSKKSKGKVRTGVDAILPVVGGVAVVAAIALIFTRKKNK
ncbi:hypothetical protein [Anaerococcus marasmi]|uniref:hypothetical protein n=1 Tax=Anaerococcus marasmi TaxID=2057797 RepID=UPI000CF8AFF3|nr:hypothetical protein [Anaerococcus marasmi]